MRHSPQTVFQHRTNDISLCNSYSVFDLRNIVYQMGGDNCKNITNNLLCSQLFFFFLCPSLTGCASPLLHQSHMTNRKTNSLEVSVFIPQTLEGESISDQIVSYWTGTFSLTACY